MERTYQKVEVVGVSDVSFTDAAKKAVEAAAKANPASAWFEVVEQRGRIDKGQIVEFQVTVKVGYRMV